MRNALVVDVGFQEGTLLLGLSLGNLSDTKLDVLRHL